MAPSRGLVRSLKPFNIPQICLACHTRGLHAITIRLSGHNRWSKIRHDKGRNDAAKNRQRSVFAQEITTASRLFGPEPNMNPRLADLVVKAKREGFPKASIEAAIARGQGRSLSGANLESVTVEAILPNNVAVIVECETDSKLRTLMDVRLVVKDNGGTATPASYLFNKKGRIVFDKKDGVGSMDALDAALEAGATDVDDGPDGGIVVYAEPGDTKAVGDAVAKALSLQINTSDIIWDPNDDTKVGLTDEEAAQELCSFVDELQGSEAGVQSVAMNVARGSVGEEVWNDLRSRIAS